MISPRYSPYPGGTHWHRLRLQSPWGCHLRCSRTGGRDSRESRNKRTCFFDVRISREDMGSQWKPAVDHGMQHIFPQLQVIWFCFLSQNGEDQYNMITWMWKLAINTRILFWFSCFICERYVGRSCLMDADGFIFYSFLILFWLFEPNRDNRFESLVEASVQFLAGKIIGWFHGANPNNSWWSWLSFPWFYFTCSIIFPYFPSSSLIFHRRAVWSFSGCSRPLRRRPTSWCLAVVHVQLVVVGPNTIPTIGFEWVVSSH